MELRKPPMKYGFLVVFIRHDSAEIWGFRYGITLFIGTLQITASTGVFVRVIFAFKRSIKYFSSPSSITLTLNNS
jgi:hypothetical protein